MKDEITFTTFQDVARKTLTLKDIRDAVKSLPVVPEMAYVQVSDDYIVILENGKPISSMEVGKFKSAQSLFTNSGYKP